MTTAITHLQGPGVGQERAVYIEQNLVSVEDARGHARKRGFKRFFFHYHKSASRAAKRNVLTVHWMGKCHPVNHILCAVKIETHAQKRQPHCVMRGFARTVEVFEGVGKWRGGTVARIT